MRDLHLLRRGEGGVALLILLRSLIFLGAELGFVCSETGGHNGSPGDHHLLRADGAVDLGAGEEVGRKLGQISGSDDQVVFLLR